MQHLRDTFSSSKAPDHVLVTREALQRWVEARELLQPDAGLTPARYMGAAQSA